MINGTIGHGDKSAESTLQKHPTGNPIFVLFMIIGIVPIQEVWEIIFLLDNFTIDFL